MPILSSVSLYFLKFKTLSYVITQLLIELLYKEEKKSNKRMIDIILILN